MGIKVKSTTEEASKDLAFKLSSLGIDIFIPDDEPIFKDGSEEKQKEKKETNKN